MATATTHGARDHARAQEGTRAEAMPVVPAGDWPHAALRGGPSGVGGDRGGRQLHAQGADPGHRTAPDRRHGRRLRAPPAVRRGPPVGAPERRRHRQGPVERLPGPGAVAPLRPGTGARLGGRRLLRTARRPVRHLHARTQHRAVRGRNSAVRVPGRTRAVQAGRRQERARAPRSAALALLLPGRGGTRRRLTGLHRLVRSRRQRHPPRRAGRHRADRERAAPGRSAPGLHEHPLEVLAWRARATAAGDPLWEATPEGRRAFLNTAEFLATRGLA